MNYDKVTGKLHNSYTMVCPPVHGDNPQDLAMDYLTYRWTTLVYLSYTTYISADLEHYKIFHAKDSKGSIKLLD